ncbi:MAG: carbohydrate binding domain-containing protein [Bacteroidia bacterium]
MKNTTINNLVYLLFAAFVVVAISSCARDFEELEPATFPTNGDVFIDGFSSGLAYAAFGGSKVTAFDVDNDVVFDGEASMRFEVPDAGDPNGGYAGGVFYDPGGRDFSGYDALTFWIKASQPATLDEIGFGNDLGESRFLVTMPPLPMNTNWKKVIIPIPDPAKLTRATGMLYYAEAPENDKGYTFWIDEVKFEKLGTLAHPKASILEGQDRTVLAETGEVIAVTGLTSTYNLPTGVDLTVRAASGFFTFSSSETAVATVTESGDIRVLDAGTTVITGKLGEIEATGSLTIESSGAPIRPQGPAPTPTVNPDSVISLYSNAYTNVPVDVWNTYWEFSTAETEEIQINGDDVLRYKNLNFVGIEFASQTIDVSEMTHFHIDIWTPDNTAPPAAFKVLLVDFGPDNTFAGGDDASHELTFTSPLLQTEQWVGIDVPLSQFAGLVTKANLAQMVLSGDLPNVFVDNVYFYDDGTTGGGGDAPTVAAPTPSQAPADVISIFSDAYTNIAANLNPDWGQSTSYSEVNIGGSNTILLSGFDYQGIELGSSQDVSGMTSLHIDYWTANSSAFNAFLISTGPAEMAKALSVPTTGWGSIDIPLTDFTPTVDLADIIQLKFDGNGTIYLDNIYFHKGGGSGGGDMPTTAAPTPTQAASGVIAVFSDAYTNLVGTNLNPDWGQATVTSEILIDGNNTLEMKGLNYQGIELAGNNDVSAMNSLHIDVWTKNSTELKVFLISPGPNELAKSLTVPTSGWASFDIPLTDFAPPVNLTEVFQFKFEGNGDIYIDNIFFHTGGGGSGGNSPTVAAPSPSYNAADVISIFSDAYTNVPGTNLNPGWGQATVTREIPIAGNNTLEMKGLNYQGFELAGNQNVSGMTWLHLDFWTANSTELKIFLISPGPAETPYSLTVPTSGWASVDIPLTEFSSVVDLANVFQFKFEGNGDIYFDNILFRK